MKQSGGTVWLESTEGRGTVARVCLPRLGEPEGAGADEAVGKISSAPAGGTILLAEDEPALRMLVKDVLGRAGYRVLAADNVRRLVVRAVEAGLDPARPVAAPPEVRVERRRAVD